MKPMKPCDEFDIVGFLEGQASDQEDLRRHIDGCPECRAKLEKMQTVIAALVDSQQQENVCGEFRRKGVDGILDGGAPDQEHLEACPACREFYQAAEEALLWCEKKSPQDWEPLPDKIREMAAERHRRWLKNRLKRIVGQRDASQDEDVATKERIRRMMEDAPDDLPKAAFPDDLVERDDEDED
jgi:hypothetical protein